MNRVLISCGGTGGHLAPGIALAEGLVARGHTCWLAISHKKVDARIVQKYPHLAFIKVPGSPFTLHPAGFVRFVAGHVKGLLRSNRLLKRLQPDLVIGFGGFGSAGITAASFLRKVPFALHESNRVPGRAVRLLSRLGPLRVYLPTGVRLNTLSPDTIRFYGCPVRKEIQRQAMPKARAALGIDEKAKLLVLLGGSQGATVLNEWAAENFESLAREGISLYCVTGMDKGEARVLESPTRDGGVAHAWFVPFTDQVSEVLSSADLVVSRAGAGTIAELIRCRTPAILIPYPFAADNHQQANAAFFEQQGGGVVVGQDFMGDLSKEVLAVIFNDWLLQKFRSNLQRMDRDDSLQLIMDDLEELCRNAREGKTVRVLEMA
jgi:UDP-N-acetylglucosamine--N-acetylmuramyl-(pentapeptide) pyrophosphoryl-undecaprenol N-acetylglucosamine transferase